MGTQFKLTNEFKETVTSVLGKLSFERISKLMPLLEKDILSEPEINAIISEMGRMPWFDVKDFFKKLPTIIEQLNEEPIEPIEDDTPKKRTLKVNK